MSEQKATERISLYIDGELTAQEREEVARRIEADEEWAEIHERLCRTSRAIGDFFKESNATLPEDGKVDAVDRIVRASAASISADDARRLRKVKRRPGSILVALLIVTAVILAMLTDWSDDSDPAAYIQALDERLGELYFEAEVSRATPLETFRVWLGPNGGVHLFIDASDGKRHVAVRDDRVWTWRADGAVAHEVGPESEGDAATVREVRLAWRKFRDSVHGGGVFDIDFADQIAVRLSLVDAAPPSSLEVDLEDDLPRSVRSMGWTFSSLKTLTLKAEDFTPQGSGMRVSPR